MIRITKQHKEQFNDMRKRLSVIGCREATFTSVEILFYEALSIARTYGYHDNSLLQLFQTLEQTEYRGAMARYAKSAQREKAIKRFITKFRSYLATIVKESVEYTAVNEPVSS